MEFKNCLNFQKNMTTAFDDYFKQLDNSFDEAGDRSEINSPKGKIVWPDGFGVYTVWRSEVSVKGLIYVGLTGRYSRDENGDMAQPRNSFQNKATRWTPYRFCESPQDTSDHKFSFRFGPKYSKTADQNRHKYERDAYSQTIPYKELIVLTFDLTNNKEYSPALLESEILTRYLFETGTLPPANNSL